MRVLLFLLGCLPQLMASDAARDVRWRQDLDTLATRLPALHPNLFFQSPRAVFDQAVSELNDAIPGLSDAQVIVSLARIVALAHDGHTSISLTQRNTAFRRIPIQLRWFEDGLFVTAAGPDYPRTLGAKVLRIGNLTPDEAYRAVTPLISHENEIYVREISPNYFVTADVLQALGIVPDNRSVRFELQEPDGARFELDIATLEPGGSVRGIQAPDPATGFIPLWRQRTSENYWFTYLEGSRTLYFAYNACAEQAGLPFAEFNAQLWSVFDSKPLDRVIVDLRNNPGGNSLVLAPFLAAANARMERFQQLQPVLIIGRRTYSSAILNATQLRKGKAMVYGEPSGGSPNQYGEVMKLVLPNSQLTIDYSTRYYAAPGYPMGSMMPDVVLKMYSADYFGRHDPFLAAVLAGSAPRLSPPPSPLALVNAAHFRAGPVAPGSLAALFGEFKDATEVQVDGEPARLLAVAAGQINLRVPPGTATGTAAIRVRSGAAEVAAGSAVIEGTAPGLFAADPSEAPADSAIAIYGTGQGSADQPPGTQVYFGAERAEVLYSGAHGAFPGLWQVNVRIPDGLAGEYPLFVVVGASASNAIAVKVTK